MGEVKGDSGSYSQGLLLPRLGREILWVEDPIALEELVGRLAREARLAVDLEADSLYRYRERICLVQVCSAREVALIDPLALGDLKALRPLLEDPNLEKVFHGADYDMRLLKGAGFKPRGIFDTMVAARCVGAKRLGLSDLLEERLGIRLEKRFQRADWSRRPLPAPMLDYAVRDSCYLLALRDSLASELQTLGRMELARAHFLALEKIEPLRRNPPNAMKIPGARKLDHRSLAALQALLEWREQQAREKDVPVFKILPSETLLALAREKPSDLKSLLGIPGITKKVAELWAEGLLRALQEGLKRDPFVVLEPPKASQNPPGSRNRFMALKQIRDQRAKEEGLDPGILCPNSLLKALASSEPRHLNQTWEELLTAWQQRLLGEKFQQVLSGSTHKKYQRSK